MGAIHPNEVKWEAARTAQTSGLTRSQGETFLPVT
jgi:hypothetical protein